MIAQDKLKVAIFEKGDSRQVTLFDKRGR